MKYWVFTANVDGFRCDYADGPPVDFWKQAIDSLRNITTHNLLLLAEGNRTSNFTVGFDFNFGFSFYEQLKTIYSNNNNVQLIDNLNNSEYNFATNGQQVVRYTSNHDVNSSDGTPMDLFGGKRGAMAALAVISYMKSVPMIYNGQEVGSASKILFPFTSVKINWTVNSEVNAEYKRILAFRNSSNAIRRGKLTSYSSADICSFTKEVNGEKVLVMANLRNSINDYMLPLHLANTIWTDVMNGSNLSLAKQVTLQPYSYLVLKQ
jgi:glycosidase